jgi:hypothetical protein
MTCPFCSSGKVQSRGKRNKRNRYVCGSCGRWFSEKRTTIPPARILLFDVETLPLHVRVWSLGGNDWISPNNIIKDWCILSWSAKWLYDDHVYGEALTPCQALARDDKELIATMLELINQADIVVTHNGVRFDHKKLNTRLLIHGYPPPSHYKTVDTLQVARSNFAFSSNKLDYINQQLGIHQKDTTDYELWVDCDNGDRVAIDKMLDYNKNDVVILEELYVRLRPWMNTHPSMCSYVDKDINICVCGSKDLSYTAGYYRTNVNRYRGWRCNNCGKIGRSSKAEKR